MRLLDRLRRHLAARRTWKQLVRMKRARVFYTWPDPNTVVQNFREPTFYPRRFL